MQLQLLVGHEQREPEHNGQVLDAHLGAHLGALLVLRLQHVPQEAHQVLERLAVAAGQLREEDLEVLRVELALARHVHAVAVVPARNHQAIQAAQPVIELRQQSPAN